MRFVQGLVLTLTAGLVFLCGCDYSGVKPSSAFSYATGTAVYTKGVRILPNSPINAGAAISYSVAPSLPAGLNLSATTGIISGIPTAVAAVASYTVTATYSTGSATAILTITVNDQRPSALSYTTTAAVYTEGEQITPNSPTSRDTSNTWMNLI